ncbi:tyrosine-type recombinase/integrase [Paraburkholderia mimosarum]|uniref:tyrosine-type recombinase/integrase n=1 Tax=Paraburkholderia mimosarum TaxID=312026 RepID=UPI0004828ED1|nr:tyrosine-type recombinase/integrase [Paraburkholderia mimosarum]
MNSLREALQDYLSLRRSLGFKLTAAGRGLLAFVIFMEARRAEHITTHAALEWAQQPSSVTPAYRAQLLSWVRGFAIYRQVSDPKTEVPPCDLLPFRPKHARVHIYKDDEIRRLLDAALKLPPLNSLRPWTYYCLLGTLSVSGLRIGEAMALEDRDVDLEERILTIRTSKFGKSRIVPVAATTATVLAEYRRRRDTFFPRQRSSYFFVSNRGNKLCSGQVHETFYTLSRQIGIRAEQTSHGPRLHDLRHRFAIQTILRWYRHGQDVERRLPALSTYLGHSRVAHTFWYFNAAPQLMQLAARRLHQQWEAQK